MESAKGGGAQVSIVAGIGIAIVGIVTGNVAAILVGVRSPWWGSACCPWCGAAAADAGDAAGRAPRA